MAWRCTGRSNDELVDKLKEARQFTDPRVGEAMKYIDRADFTSKSPYEDSPQGIGWNATITAPHMHAAALERLHDKLIEGSRVLDVGSGSGYLTAAMAIMVGPTGKVNGIEHIPELVELSRKNIAKHHSHLLSSGRVTIIEGDGRFGYPIQGGYHAIHVGAAAPSLPVELIKQLADGGRMVVPVGGNRNQEFIQIDREGEKYRQKTLHGVIYVPLTSKHEQLNRF